MDKRLAIMKDARKAHATLVRAEKAALAAIIKAIPIGTLLHVNISFGTWIEFRVTGHSACWWHEPCEIHGVNVKTGKRRKFIAGSSTYPFSVLEVPHG